ncbi:MAG: hypothetical protein HKN57_14870 [Xanthomonadales bacterium]|nr:hypothetical protein [Gammaproteobacteria bacterium]MBT8054846.1 hypothetical protein [Gammaproteobacteria bacterium]NND58527.1 hypothetical protein [Xanthomonadales bacterium]NNK51111.1 hypothetical protein [Xanthomonadales bacterium]
MISEFFIALVKAGLPVGLASYGLVWWALRNDYLSPAGTIKSFEQEAKKRRKDKNRKKEGDTLHRKWLAFGGGFYGVVGLLTYALVELREIRDFVAQLGGFMELIRNISFDLFVELFIDALQNFIVAIAWPAFWLGEIRSNHIWIWFLVAYGAYWAGTQLALRQSGIAGESTD